MIFKLFSTSDIAGLFSNVTNTPELILLPVFVESLKARPRQI